MTTNTFRLGALAAVGTLTLTACFSSGAASGDTENRARVAMLQPPRSGLSQFSDDAFKLSRWSTAETLITLDDLGDAEPGLATGWNRVDDRTWSFDLRPDVSFHNGTPLDASAVVTALTAATTSAPKPRILDGVELTVSATDDDTVAVSTKDIDPLVPQRLSSPQLSILAPEAYSGGGSDPVGTGTGPFVLTAVDGTSGPPSIATTTTGANRRNSRASMSISCPTEPPALPRYATGPPMWWRPFRSRKPTTSTDRWCTRCRCRAPTPCT